NQGLAPRPARLASFERVPPGTRGRHHAAYWICKSASDCRPVARPDPDCSHALPWGQLTVLDKLCQCTGYLASVLVLATLAMKNMHLLRITAILSNIAFITDGALYQLPPIIGLHLLLLPINLVRLIELYRARGEGQRRQLPWAPRSV